MFNIPVFSIADLWTQEPQYTPLYMDDIAELHCQFDMSLTPQSPELQLWWPLYDESREKFLMEEQWAPLI